MYHPSWNASARESFEKCIFAHGGWKAWEELDQFKFRFKEFSGPLLFTKGHNRTFFTPKDVSVFPKTRCVIFDYGTHQDRFENGRLFLPILKLEIANGRTLFQKKFFETWCPQHSLYFFGYAVVNYLSYPFILPQFELKAFEDRNSISVFEIAFPEKFDTHSPFQTFYFGSDHLLARHDYKAELVGSCIYGVHYTRAYKRYKNLMVATVREVKPKLGPIPLPGNAIYAELEFQE